MAPDPSRLRTRLLIVITAAITLIASQARGEAHLIPFWAHGLHGVDGSWYVQVSVANPGETAATVRVVALYPSLVQSCDGCPWENRPVTIAPGAATIVTPVSGTPGVRFIAGAFVLESDVPVKIDTTAFRPGDSPIRQRLLQGNGWLPPGQHVISGVQRDVVDWRTNLVLVNPTDQVLTVSAWIGRPEENLRSYTVDARSARIVRLPEPLCSGTPCVYEDRFPPDPLQVHVTADREFFAAVSSAMRTWAVFTLPDRMPGRSPEGIN